MSVTPYSSLPNHCFWRRAHRVDRLIDVDPVVRGLFKIAKQTKVATAGSCFAQHISNRLQQAGFNYFITEAGHPLIDSDVKRAYNYGVFSARFGNIYTAAQLRQLMDRAYGAFTPIEGAWEGEDGRFYDPFRPAIQPDGFNSLDDLESDRKQHFAAVRRLFEEAEVMVFTLGLTEAWRSRQDGAVFPLCPGVAAGTFSGERHEFVNYSVDEVVSDLSAFITATRLRNPSLKFMLTVSPVPLMATAVDSSVITSTAYSKAVLRVAAEQVSKSFEDVAYFPSYEVITGPAARGRYYAEDLREVRPAGVSHVMRLFMKHYVEAGTARREPERAREAQGADSSTAGDEFSDIAKDLAVVCEEEMLDR